MEVFLLRHLTEEFSIGWENRERGPFNQFTVVEFVRGLMERASDATVLDFPPVGKRPTHVSAQPFSGNVLVFDVADHEGFQPDGHHLGFTWFEFLRFNCVLPYHFSHFTLERLPCHRQGGTLGL